MSWKWPRWLVKKRQGRERASKGLRRHGMRSYRVDGPVGSYVIVRVTASRWIVRKADAAPIYTDEFSFRFPRLAPARAFAERMAGL